MSGKITRTGPDPVNNFEEISTQAQHSVELSRNAKGDYSWNIKLYCRDGEGQKMLDSLADMDAWLKKRFSAQLEVKKEG